MNERKRYAQSIANAMPTATCIVLNARSAFVTHWMPLPEPPKEVENG